MGEIATKIREIGYTNGLEKEALLQGIATVHEELIAAKAHVERLQQNKSTLQEKLNVATSPILSIPVELATEIFTLACDDGDGPQFDILPTPLTLGHTCRAWRRLACSMPHLWQTVVIRFSEERIDIQGELLQEWLDRSKELGLNFYFACPPHKFDSTAFYEPPPSLFKQLLQTSNRWSSLYSHNCLSLRNAIAETRASYPFPMLSRLRLYITDFQETLHDDLSWTFGATPSLRSMDVKMFNPEGLDLEWERLTHLKVQLHVGFCALIFPVCTLLESCELSSDVCSMYDTADDLVPPDPLPSTLSKLKTLSLTGQARAVTHLLDCVTAPILEKLSIKVHPLRRWEWADMEELMGDFRGALEDLFSRSSYKLTELSLCGLNAESEDYVDILHPLSSLRRLSLTIPRPGKITDDFFDALNLEDNPDLFSQLSEANLEGDLGSVDIDTVIKMVRTRLSPPVSEDKPQPALLRAMHVTYWNKSWAEKSDEGRMAKFYSELAALSSGQTSLTWQWNDGAQT
ncbi:hypothetical protein CPC08DRAFT_706150 [Agrocybe pediades]|nr:hypothetical protein CPC08DRAFT_706150 [Agrocybe pediades]